MLPIINGRLARYYFYWHNDYLDTNDPRTVNIIFLGITSIMLYARFMAQLPDLMRQHISVALSGGVDSVVLLHLLHRIQPRLSLSAVHIHHGLNAQADDWLLFCRDYCADLNIPFIAQCVTINTHKKGIEAAARQARYVVFAQQDCDILALAHHADDQVETFLLSALRGGGVRALAAMPLWRPLNDKIILWRPLLIFSRDEIESYAQQHGLHWVNDPSNSDPSLRRNAIRHKILPAISNYFPYYQSQLLASIDLLQDELALINEVVAQDWQRLHQDGVFSYIQWRKLSEQRQLQALHQFAQYHQLGTPRRASIWDFARVLRQSNRAEWHLPSGRAIARRGVLLAVKNENNLE